MRTSNGPQPIKLLLVDDHRILLDGLRTLLDRNEEFAVVAEASDGHQALLKLRSYLVDIVLMDIRMPNMDGFEAAKDILAQFPNVKVLILSMHNERSYIEKMYQIGVSGYLLKSSGRSEILDGIRNVAQGKQHFAPELLPGLFEESNKSNKGEITRREREVLGFIALGMNNQEISQRLSLSVETINTHRKNLLRKLEVNNTAALLRLAMQRGWLEL